ncbi:SCO family protein [Xanthomonas hortorum]|uniref:SCO family protein n=1 Tax=Xanthomonas hortorum TaxID=56454 RepID=A0AA47I9M9_9XANT|nr:SCO family protein [Xanthomonas hortorum]WAH63976.1 SCO family protein [Xanthomonas hortorum]
MRMFLLSACGLMLLSSTAVAVAAQQDPHAAHQRMAQAQTLAASPTEVQVPEVALLDAHGQPHDLQPLLQEGIVVVDFMYTSCTTICPALTAVMGSVQRELALRPRGKVTLISITLDPRHDTPAQLLDFSRRVRAGERWYWLTGSPSDIDRVLRGFGLPVGGRPEDHGPVMLVGDARQGRWWRWVGMPEPARLLAAVDALAADAGARGAP